VEGLVCRSADRVSELENKMNIYIYNSEEGGNALILDNVHRSSETRKRNDAVYLSQLILNGRLYTEKGPSRSNPDLDCSSTIGSTTITMSGTLDLNCLVLGHDTSRIFPIEIAERKTVGALKDAIKDKKRPALDHVPADTLLLWKVSIPVSRNLADNLSKFDFVDEGSLLPTEELSEVFSDSPGRKCLHIVVRAPPAGELDNVSYD